MDGGDSKKDELDWEEWNPNELSFVQHMIAGSIAGLAEHVSVFPIDTIKTQLQCEKCGSTSLFQTWNCASRIVRKEGIFRLWRGVSAMFAGCIPAHAAYFSIYENVKAATWANNLSTGHHPWQSALAGASAACAHDLCMNPFDVIKQRMQLGFYRNIYQCTLQIFSTEGIAGFYVSLPTTLAMNIPHGCVQVAVNESCRKFLDPSGNYSTNTLLLSGVIAGASAAIVTNPLDVIKTRLQTRNLEPCPRSTAKNLVNIPSSEKLVLGATDIIKSIFQSNGMLGFFRGTFARVLVQAPGCAVTWTVYELMKKSLSNWKG